jgi:hypothetical protein
VVDTFGCLLAVSSHVRCNSKAKKNQPSYHPSAHEKKQKKQKIKALWRPFFKEISIMFATNKLSIAHPLDNNKSLHKI